MSAPKTVAIVGSEDDVHTLYVADAVRRAGARTVLLETAAPRVIAAGEEVTWDGQRVDARAVYIKSLRLRVPAPQVTDLLAGGFDTWPDRYRAERERHSLVLAALRVLTLRAAVVVNPIGTYDLHLEKLAQAERLADLGFPVPASLGTNDPEAARAFCARHDAVIAKPLSGGALAELVTDASPFERLSDCPVLLQSRIIGPEARAYVLDGEPLAAFSIPTEGVVDARENLDRVAPTTLSERDWQLCLDAARALGLVFAAVDLRWNDDGPFLLEVNPAPAVAFHEDPVDGVVVRALASFLVAHA